MILQNTFYRHADKKVAKCAYNLPLSIRTLIVSQFQKTDKKLIPNVVVVQIELLQESLIKEVLIQVPVIL